MTVANWLGIGEDNVMTVPTADDNEMIVAELKLQMRQAVEGGARIACIVATTGTTDAFGLDDVDGIVSARDEVRGACN